MDSSDLKKLAHQFMMNAVKACPGDNIWVEYQGPVAQTLAEACRENLVGIGARALMVNASADEVSSTIGQMSLEEIAAYGQRKLTEMQGMQGYIRIKDDDDQEGIVWSDEQRKAYKLAMRDMIQYRVKNTRWLVTAAPTADFAKACRMELPVFEKFYRDVCLADYSAMSEAVQPLTKLMTEGKQVRILSPGQETDLRFSIEGIPAVPCTGTFNIPDGECFTAPVKDSINGTIKFGPSAFDGQRFAFIKLRFKGGHVEEASAESAERTQVLNDILNTDTGARYVGEFAVNFNPFIQHPTGSILFDEKIDGGIHLAMGNCYDEAPNGNESAVHWDMVHIQRPDYGGGELYIDDRLIRKDGIFVVPELFPLNPENLKAATAKSQLKM